MTLKNLINVRRIAVHNRLSKSIEVYIEKCYKHYSKTYHVSLLQAKAELAPEEVALIFMEDEMEEWTPQEVLDVKAILDDSERAVLSAPVPGEEEPDSMDDDQWIAEQNKILKKQEEAKKKSQDEIVKKTHEAIEQLTQTFKKTTEELKKE